MAKILIIDDEVLLRENLMAFLEDEGHEVVTTASAESGLQKLTAFEPNLVVVDLRLEGISGERFVKAAYNINPHVGFIIHTGSQEYSLPRALEDLGITSRHLLFKPLTDLGQLSALIDEMLEDREQKVTT